MGNMPHFCLEYSIEFAHLPFKRNYGSKKISALNVQKHLKNEKNNLQPIFFISRENIPETREAYKDNFQNIKSLAEQKQWKD